MALEVAWLLELLDEGFDGRAWHGPNLVQAVRRVDAESAAWRPASSRRCIWEVVLHCAYWKYRVRRRLAPGTAATFPRRGVDWPRLPRALDEAGWQADVARLTEEHRRLREVVAALPADSLRSPSAGHRHPPIEHIRGIALHDTYHAGQIRLVRRLMEEANDRETVAG